MPSLPDPQSRYIDVTSCESIILTRLTWINSLLSRLVDYVATLFFSASIAGALNPSLLLPSHKASIKLRQSFILLVGVKSYTVKDRSATQLNYLNTVLAATLSSENFFHSFAEAHTSNPRSASLFL